MLAMRGATNPASSATSVSGPIGVATTWQARPAAAFVVPWRRDFFTALGRRVRFMVPPSDFRPRRSSG